MLIMRKMTASEADDELCVWFGCFDLLHSGSEPIMKIMRKMTATEADDEL